MCVQFLKTNKLNMYIGAVHLSCLLYFNKKLELLKKKKQGLLAAGYSTGYINQPS